MFFKKLVCYATTFWFTSLESTRIFFYRIRIYTTQQTNYLIYWELYNWMKYHLVNCIIYLDFCWRKQGQVRAPLNIIQQWRPREIERWHTLIRTAEKKMQITYTKLEIFFIKKIEKLGIKKGLVGKRDGKKIISMEDTKIVLFFHGFRSKCNLDNRKQQKWFVVCEEECHKGPISFHGICVSFLGNNYLLKRIRIRKCNLFDIKRKDVWRFSKKI